MQGAHFHMISTRRRTMEGLATPMRRSRAEYRVCNVRLCCYVHGVRANCKDLDDVASCLGNPLLIRRGLTHRRPTAEHSDARCVCASLRYRWCKAEQQVS